MKPCDCSVSRPRWTRRERRLSDARVLSVSLVMGVVAFPAIRLAVCEVARRRWGGMGVKAALSRGSLDLVGTDEKVSWNIPLLADLVNHFDRKRAPARQDLRRARARAQELGKLRLGVSQFLDRMVEDVNRVEVLVEIDGPSLFFVCLDERKEHVELVALFRSLGRAPASLDFRECGPVVFVGANWPDFH